MTWFPHSPTPGFLVWRLSMKWRAAVDRALSPVGLTHAQYTVLSSLFGMQQSGFRPSQRELADHIGLEPIYISKLARTLQAAALITRDEHPGDTRARQLSLTPRGFEVATQAIAIVRDLQDQLTEPLGGVESERTQDLMQDLGLLLSQPPLQGKELEP